MHVRPSPGASESFHIRDVSDSPRRLAGIALTPSFASAAIAGTAVAGLAAGGALRLAGQSRAADVAWIAGTAAVLIVHGWATTRALMRRTLGVDAIAILAMATALAMGEYLAGALVAVMMAGGAALERWAAARARRDLSLLVSRAPRIAHVVRDHSIDEVPVDDVRVGDAILVRAGEIVPVDGELRGDSALLDESALTGEPLPVTRVEGEILRSGIANIGGAIRIKATSTAAESTYAGVVRLVQQASLRRAPFQRMADRYAGVLLPLTVGLAGLAWAASGDSVRALAVLVVATPCPLILAAPVALVSGVSRAARRGVIVKGAEVIERLASVGVVLFDKTGTLTLGTPAIARIVPAAGYDADEVIRVAASLDQFSTHPLAEAIVHHAQALGLQLSTPTVVSEEAGRGIRGRVDAHAVVVGQADWVASGPAGATIAALNGDLRTAPGAARVVVTVDDVLAGVVVVADRTRDDARDAVARLRASGVREVWLVTGDDQAVGDAVGRAAGVDRVAADRSPSQKLAVVRDAQDAGHGAVMMVGDGVNDAPALAAADVGVALGAAGATVASEAADAVVMIDRIDRVADAVSISRRAMGIARQSVLAGMIMSLAAMVVAAFGGITPVAGAVLQEGIDLAVIANALRALRPERAPVARSMRLRPGVQS